MRELEDTSEFRPRFDEHGLIGAIVTDAADGAVLMFAFMDDEALRLTRITGLAHFWSRSRGRLWKKGETSGETMRVVDLLVDCDQDMLLLKVEPQGRGAACHTGRRSCFYRRLSGDALEFIDSTPLFDPTKVYKPA
ncbi:MAG: phosphoribosyl-AMP cyclohydrolase [Rhizobiales bacterium]|nr:phosphoribosyl-AMP cyclohydrolase [Hyphomicrobiales bacterium]